MEGKNRRKGKGKMNGEGDVPRIKSFSILIWFG